MNLGEKVRFHIIGDESAAMEDMVRLSEQFNTMAPPSFWVLIEGVDASIMKTSTLCNVDLDEDVCIFWPLQFNTLSVAKTAPEPLNPSELHRMVEGLR
ncbi:hypothetical protein V6N12_064684 [Hibiscus sabdariffa]|uniref:Uncharacterized protein n=1 Tax=Hibiscus sabdariffa TaxID=183260 RepID=A0ABR2G6K1_9ROSI